MDIDQWYLGYRIEQKLYCFCKDGAWRLYSKCEENWSQVEVLSRTKISNCKHNIIRHHKIVPDKIILLNNFMNRMIYIHLAWNRAQLEWQVLAKVLSPNYRKACTIFKPDKTKNESVIHYSQLQYFNPEVLSQVNTIKLS